MKPNRDEILQRLISEWHYPQAGAELLTNKLLALQPELLSEFQRWWLAGGLPEREVAGYTVSRLQAEHSMNPIAAILTLDWLLREPEQAKASLSRGHDQVRR